MKKVLRQNAILDIIKNNTVQSQQELLEYLNERGIKTTQATISRDFDDLYIDKNRLTTEGFAYSQNKKMTQLKKDRQFLSFPITDIKQKRDMVQLQTHPGMAEALGEEIKAKNLEGLFSVIENDALVLIIFYSVKDASAFIKYLHQL
ncbi:MULTISPECIES: arginine repressor [Holzapfeliella]